MTERITAAAYVRVSTDEQAEQGLSIPVQKSRLLAYCQAQGWELHDYYVDDGWSGKDLNRPAMQRLAEDARAGLFNIVLVLKLDRLSRRQKDVLYLLEDVFDPAGIGFKSATESFDTTTPFGKAALGMMAVFAQLERETIVERSRMGKIEAAKKGRWHGGTIYGYDYKPGTYVLQIRETEARVVRELFDAYINHDKGIHSMANELNHRKIPGPGGGRWTKQTVRLMLSNATYAGYSKHKGNLYKGMHEAIVTGEQWKRACELLNERRENRHRGSSSKALLAGVIYCAECGARMRNKAVWQNHPKEPKRIIRYYVCYSQDGTARHMVRDAGCRCGYKQMNDIDAKVINRLYEYSVNTDRFKSIVKEELTQNDTEKKNALRGLNQAQKELQQINAALSRWYSAFEKGALDPDELAERVKELRSKRSYLEESTIDWELKRKEKTRVSLSADVIITDLKNFKKIWESAEEEEKRDIMTGLVKAVYISKDNEIDVKFNIW